VALEDRGQQALLKYLKGDQVRQEKDDFVACAADFAAARAIDSGVFAARSARGLLPRPGGAIRPETRTTEGVWFCWKRAVRIDARAAYAYNALGIAYLEQASYSNAALAFQDAIQARSLLALSAA